MWLLPLARLHPSPRQCLTLRGGATPAPTPKTPTASSSRCDAPQEHLETLPNNYVLYGGVKTVSAWFRGVSLGPSRPVAGSFTERISTPLYLQALQHLKYPERLQKLLLTPEREIAVELAILRDNGEVATFNAYRVQHDNSRGPYKGGLRFHPDVNIDDVRRCGYGSRSAESRAPTSGGRSRWVKGTTFGRNCWSRRVGGVGGRGFKKGCHR